MDSPKTGDSVYIKSKGVVSDMIVYVSTGGKPHPNAPSHEAKIFTSAYGKTKLLEVVFSGRRCYDLQNYIDQGAKVWIKRDINMKEKDIPILINHLQSVKIKGYDWGLICAFLARFILRKLFPKSLNWNWVTKVWNSKVCFVCSEFCNSGRRAIGMDVKEQETPWDNKRKIPAINIAAFNL